MLQQVLARYKKQYLAYLREYIKDHGLGCSAVDLYNDRSAQAFIEQSDYALN